MTPEQIRAMPHRVVNGEAVLLTQSEIDARAVEEAQWAKDVEAPKPKPDPVVTQSQLVAAFEAAGVATPAIDAAITAVKATS